MLKVDAEKKTNIINSEVNYYIFMRMLILNKGLINFWSFVFLLFVFIYFKHTQLTKAVPLLGMAVNRQRFVILVVFAV